MGHRRVATVGFFILNLLAVIASVMVHSFGSTPGFPPVLRFAGMSQRGMNSSSTQVLIVKKAAVEQNAEKRSALCLDYERHCSTRRAY